MGGGGVQPPPQWVMGREIRPWAGGLIWLGSPHLYYQRTKIYFLFFSRNYMSLLQKVPDKTRHLSLY